MQISDLPKYHELMRPTLIALDKIGGSASLNEINDAVIEFTNLAPEALGIEYESGAGTVIADRLSWARSYLKGAGLLASGGRGVWLLTDEGRLAKDWPEDQLRKRVSAAVREQQDARKSPYLSKMKCRPAIQMQRIQIGGIFYWLSCDPSIRLHLNGFAKGSFESLVS